MEIFVPEAKTETENAYEYTSLHCAILKNNETTVAALLAAGADKEAKTDDGSTPLHQAVGHGHTHIAKLLLDAGVLVNSIDERGNRPLHIAAARGHTELLILLLQNHAPKDALNNLGCTALHKAASAGFAAVIHELLAAQALIHARDNNGLTALHEAAEYGHSEAVSLLLARGAICDAVDNYGNTPLHRASHFGKTAVVEILLKAGANKEAKNSAGCRPLHLAALNSHSSCIKTLLSSGALVDPFDYSSRTPLARAWESIDSLSESNQLSMHLLQSHGAQDKKIIVRQHAAVLTVALEEDDERLAVERLELVETTLAKMPDINSYSAKGANALHLAAKSGNIKIVQWLLKQGALIDALDHQNASALHYAVAGSREADTPEKLLSARVIVTLLIKHKATVNIRTTSGTHPLHLVKQPAIAVMLLDAGAEEKACKELFFIAVRDNNNELVRCLLALGMDKHIQIAGITPLFIAVARNHAEITSLLLFKEISSFLLDERLPKEARTKSGLNLMHVASLAGKCKVLNRLLQLNIPANVETQLGWTPLHFAAQHGHAKAVEVLLRAGKINIKKRTYNYEAPLKTDAYAPTRELEKEKEFAEKNTFKGATNDLFELPVVCAFPNCTAREIALLTLLAISKGSIVEEAVMDWQMELLQKYSEVLILLEKEELIQTRVQAYLFLKRSPYNVPKEVCLLIARKVTLY